MRLNTNLPMPRSLRWRLLLLSLLVVAPALVLLAWQLSHTFEQSVEARVRHELENHLNQLIARVRVLPGGKLQLTDHLSDPRFNVPLSGLYWQVNDGVRPLLRSRSLWDSALAISKDMPRRGGVHEYVLKGPREEDLYALVRGAWLESPVAKATSGEGTDTVDAPSRRYIFVVAVDHAEITAAERGFNRQLYFGLAALAVILFVSIAAQVLWGLKPLDRLRRQLERIRHGERKQLSAADTAELAPLIDELNKLLVAQEKAIEEARARAGNLAHGMKTPLAVLGARARDLRRRGLHEDAAEIEEQIRQLSRHIEHELARSKIHGGRAARHRTPAAVVINGIVRALKPLNDTLEWRVDVEDDLVLPMEKGDLMELVGNLMENAAKWARSLVVVRGRTDERGRPCLVVEDDGPGVPPEKYGTILKRGTRLDEQVRGSGLGLAIVGDILQSYGYTLRLFPSEMGGLGVRVVFAGKASSAS